MSAQQQVIKIDDISEENAPAIYVAGGLGQFFDAVAAEVTAEVPDLTTRKGRERIASLAAKVSKSKTAVEKPGRDYLKRLKEMPKVVEAELREFVNKMDALRDATRQPLTDWEQKELARTDKHIDGIQSIKDMASFDEPPTAAHVAQVIADLELLALDDSWEEFLPEAAQAKNQALITLRGLHAERARHEAEQAELARLREEKEMRDKKDREDQIAREAAERATQEAEEKAQRARDAEAQRVRDEQEAAEKRESDLKLQTAEAERRAEQAKREQVEAEQRAERERLEGIERQAAAVEQARLDEVKRQNDAAAEILRQQEAREADTAHRAKINRAALAAFVAGGMTEECAKQAITLIAKRQIPNVSIAY
ncbi:MULTISPECIES: phage protein [Pseudomonas]|uniref:phage protein n=1 Tax=Pseudomonas TaxID=286 RepID=UPI0005A6B0AF|nr:MULTISPECIES: phage protein [Pseudomonas]AZD93065.1 TolA protein [Pseudomonas chlororaphis subsp. aureofaciens]KAB0532776.1 hypothetical protein F7R16_11065 [Pseudomonas chlororaphis subsp. aureofaciens]TSD26036.1 hypothetical protein FCE86_031725 [Pseudomonas sp. ATCC 13985]WDG57866.1 hypothetical protein PUP52_18640 [Pseudomonas chlororaphis]WDG64079.1 hypothetical protein PUP59_18645 [Pseudomonas chlororaphis]